ncbi:MAG: hypothetical protein ABL986_09465 [Vicinamibacterales bacterium]
MGIRRHLTLTVAAMLAAGASYAATAAAQNQLTTATGLRCTFALHATGAWNRSGVPDARVTPSTLVLIFDSINADEGTAKLRNGIAGTEIAFRLSGDYLHFMQSFRTGPLYTTTVFNQQTSEGRYKAVHSRHEQFTVPLPGATSSPEQYYGECSVAVQSVTGP